MIRTKVYIAFCVLFGALLLSSSSSRLYGLDPSEIAIIANKNVPESLAIAEYYCQKRGVPTTHIIAPEMPAKERISSKTYSDQIAPAIRAHLQELDPKNENIKCLLTVYGVPLRINAISVTGPAAQWRKLTIELIDQKFGELEKTSQKLKQLAQPALNTTTTQSDKKFVMSRMPIKRQQRAASMLRQAGRALKSAQDVILTERSSAIGHQRKLSHLQELQDRLLGLQGRCNMLARQARQNLTEDRRSAIESELQTRLAHLNAMAAELKQLDEPGSEKDFAGRQRRYELLEEAAGLQGLCTVLLNDRQSFGDEESDSAFDSELSLLLWSDYRLGQWQPNYLLAHPPKLPRPAEPADSKPTLMVCRLDASTAAIATALIDKALAAEKSLLRGKVYIDARGKYEDTDTFPTFGYFDSSLRKTAVYIKENTGLEVITDNQEPLFPPGSCPDTILYCGWYSLRNYVDAFEFAPGAVGYHIASFEAETFGKSDPNSAVWCKSMLEDGITATLGAVSEPFLHAFPEPKLFFVELLGGEHCLVECFYRVKPFNSWKLTLIGDPLYRPKYSKSRGFRPAL